MHDYTVIEPRCTESDNYLDSDCGSSAGAYVLFISWNILSMYVHIIGGLLATVHIPLTQQVHLPQYVYRRSGRIVRICLSDARRSIP